LPLLLKRFIFYLAFITMLYKHKYKLAMHIVISGKHLEVGEALRSHATEFIKKHIVKYFNNAVNAHVTISKEVNHFHTHVTVNDGTGSHLIINGDGNDSDAYKSVDQAVKKIEKQLEKYKNRIKDRQKIPIKDFVPIEATKYVINDFEETEADESNAQEEIAPTVVAEKQLKLDILSVRDAVMHMNLRNLPAMLFVNAANNKVSMVYQRQDNNIAWVDTTIVVSS